MKAKLCLILSILSIQIAWAGAADSVSMIPDSGGNSGVYNNNTPRTYGWMRSVDRAASNCYTTGSSPYPEGAGDLVFDAKFFDSSGSSDAEVGNAARCEKGYEAIGAYFYSILVPSTTGSVRVERIRLYGGTRCCPVRWYILDQSVASPNSTTIVDPSGGKVKLKSGKPVVDVDPTKVPLSTATPDLN